MSGNTIVYFFYIRLAGVNIEVECISKRVYSDYIRYLAQFEKPDFVVSIDREKLLSEYSSFSKKLSNTLNRHLSIELENIESIVICRTIAIKILQWDAFLFHGSVLALNNNAYMFTAPSGTGKTTRTELWLNEFPSSLVVNGDKPLLKVATNEVYACGTPWAGKEGWNTNTMVPLRAIFLLERAEEDSIEEISFSKAFFFLLQQTYHPSDPEAMRKTIQLLKALEGKVKFYRFRSTPTPESIRLAYETARPR